jgi:hypothetical protein
MRRAILIAALALAALAALPGAAAAQKAMPMCSPAPMSCTGWYAVDVTLSWSLPAGTTDSQNCDVKTFRTDGVSGWTCSVSVNGGPLAPSTALIHIDKVAPTIAGVAPSRGADTNGWYRSPVEVRFFGNDVTSGVQGCSSGTYSGPDAAAAHVIGRCWDRAGNVSAPGTFDLRYDATAPSLADVGVSGRDHKARLEWNVPDAADIDVSRDGRRVMSGDPSGSVVDRGLRNGHRYVYVVRATDAAGNTAKKTLAVVPGPRLFGPAKGARLDGPPRLRWTSVRGADYYNVQLFRGRRKILSLWPEKPHLQLRSKWRYAGHKRRLKPGKRYRWFVWPGEGRRSSSDYGRLIGARTFVITP